MNQAMMTIPVHIVLILLFLHWVADFVFQSDWMAQNKSKDNAALTIHAFVYSATFLIPLCFVIDGAAPLFCLITFVVHWIQDYVTSRINSGLWAKGKVHYFFVSVGFDQFAHFVQLIATYLILCS